jgi:hypothetical protein
MKLDKKTNLFQPLRKIWEKIDYKDIGTYNELNKVLSENKIITSFSSNINMGLLHSIINYDNMNICLCFGLNKNESYDYYLTNLKNNYSLYGIKSFDFSNEKKQEIITKLIYQLYYFRNSFENKEILEEYIKKNLHYLSDLSNTIPLQILILVSKKKELEIINESFEDKIIYMPFDKNEKNVATSLLFCDKSIGFLKLQNLDAYFSSSFNESKIHFEKYETFLRTNIEILDRSHFMLYSSVVLYLLGARKANDLDLYIHNVSDEVQNKLEQFKQNEFDFIDYSIKGTEKWPIHWDVWLDEWAKLGKAKYFEEILGNDKYHFYFLGVKIISLEYDILRRIKRMRPAAMADLTILKERFSLHIPIPSIPNTIIKYKKIEELSEKEIRNYQEKNIPYNEELREYSIEIKNDKTRFTNTMNKYLKERYNYENSVKTIKLKIRK